MDEDKKKCRVCGWETETWEHVLEHCTRKVKEGETRRVEEILGEYEKGAAWMKKLEERRRGERTEKTEREESRGDEREL